MSQDNQNHLHIDHNGVTTHMHVGFGNNAEFTLNVSFQNSPVKEHGVNGATSEDLLAVLIHRTEILNGNFPCEENALAISHLKHALAVFEARTHNRQARGVEGENKI